MGSTQTARVLSYAALIYKHRNGTRFDANVGIQETTVTTSIESIPVKRIDGTPSSLGDFSGQVRLVVNVASKCGLTPQYEGLQQLYERYADRGFTVLGFPANDFKQQEPGTNEEIAEFCSTQYNVTFPMFSKISVKGEDQHPLYTALIDAQPKATTVGDALKQRLSNAGLLPESESDIMWNFEKFLVGRDGKVVGRFAPDVKPDDPVLVSAIEHALV